MKARDDAVIPDPVFDLLSSILKALDWMRTLYS